MPTAFRHQSDSLWAYRAEIARHPLMDVEEEKQLAWRYHRDHDRAAAEQLVTGNLRFVVKIAHEYRNYRLCMADLIQEGNLGLMRAVEKFDPEKEVRLISYAVWWIRAYIQSYILRHWSLVKLGTTQAQRRLFFSLSRAKRELESLDGPASSRLLTEKLAQQLGVKPSEVEEMEQRMSGRDLSLEAPADGQGTARIDLIPSRDTAVDEQVADQELSKILAAKIAASIGHLDARERYIIEERLVEDRPATFKDLGEHFHVSRERARQLELRAKGKLRSILRESLAGLDVIGGRTAHAA